MMFNELDNLNFVSSTEIVCINQDRLMMHVCRKHGVLLPAR